MDVEKDQIYTDIAVVKAEENGVTISSVVHEGADIEQPIRLDEGELFIMHLGNSVRGYKIRGKVEILTRLGTLKGYSKLIVERGKVDR